MSVMRSSVLSVTLRYVTSRHVKCLHREQEGTRPIQGILFVPRDNLERSEDAHFINVSHKEVMCLEVENVSVLVGTEWLLTQTGVCLSVCLCVCLCVCARAHACVLMHDIPEIVTSPKSSYLSWYIPC